MAIGSADPYARCTDLGEISLASTSRSDAELRMRARVRELGGDTLLFGMRGRSGPLANVPEEIAERRREIMAPAEPVVNAPPVAPPAAIIEREDPPPAALPPRTPRTAVVEVQPLPGELWYYGAALRCNQAE
ncbi:MAG TPA: hypothetical protein VFX89_08220 [Gammaproteobacteria bacterium]|nr:hypothetical protein [Gammaproteobacteria bacterium]